jgi:hypothetical protein
MAKWWELAIPAVSTLGGVAATSLFQMFNNKGQRRHERFLKYADEKRAAYAQFIVQMERVTEMADGTSKVRDRIKQRDENFEKNSNEMASRLASLEALEAAI